VRDQPNGASTYIQTLCDTKLTLASGETNAHTPDLFVTEDREAIPFATDRIAMRDVSRASLCNTVCHIVAVGTGC
jgi:hypothetical protein